MSRPAYNGSAHDLVNAGSTSHSTVTYKLSSDSTYSAAVPTATSAGTYTACWKLTGDENYNNVAEQRISVTISKTAAQTTSVSTTVLYSNTCAQSISLAKAIGDYLAASDTPTMCSDGVLRFSLADDLTLETANAL